MLIRNAAGVSHYLIYQQVSVTDKEVLHKNSRSDHETQFLINICVNIQIGGSLAEQ